MNLSKSSHRYSIWEVSGLPIVSRPNASLSSITELEIEANKHRWIHSFYIWRMLHDFWRPCYFTSNFEPVDW